MKIRSIKSKLIFIKLYILNVDFKDKIYNKLTRINRQMQIRNFIDLVKYKLDMIITPPSERDRFERIEKKTNRPDKNFDNEYCDQFPMESCQIKLFENQAS